MRLEIDEGLAKLLAKIKDKEPSIYGRGHAETVRFLATYYEHHKPLEELLREFQRLQTEFYTNFGITLQHGLEKALPKAAANALSNLFRDAQQPSRSGDPAAGQPKEGR